jgi:hypothetical protein
MKYLKRSQLYGFGILVLIQITLVYGNNENEKELDSYAPSKDGLVEIILSPTETIGREAAIETMNEIIAESSNLNTTIALESKEKLYQIYKGL